MIGLSQPSKIKLDSKTFVKSQGYVHTFNAFLNVLNKEAQLTEKQSSLVIFKITLPELIFELNSTPSPSPNPQTLPLRSR